MSLVTHLYRRSFPSHAHPQRWRSPRRRRALVRTPRWPIAILLALVTIGLAALAASFLAGGDLSNVPEPLLGWIPGAARTETTRTATGTAPVHIESTPSGAEVRIDGSRGGYTPLVVGLSPGIHSLTLRHPDASETVQSVDVPADGTDVSLPLWRRRPDLLPIRSVYPGSDLVDARFEADGRVALTVSMPGRTGSAQSTLTSEVWQLDPTTGNVARLAVPELPELHAAQIALTPDGNKVAYAVQASSASSASLWPAAADARSRETVYRPASVWLSTTDGSTPPTKLFELSDAAGAGAVDTERLIDLVWTPDSSQLVAITRMAGNPARARLFLIDLAGWRPTDNSPAASELLLIPAEIVSGSASTDPTGHWLAFLAHATTTSSSPDGLTLCVVELRPGGRFRDVADLGSNQSRPAAAPVAWAPAGPDGSTTRLAFVRPVAGASTNSGGLFDIFGALRASPTTSGLFVVDLSAAGVQSSQPRRLGKVTGVVAPVWRQDGTLLSVVRQTDSALALRAIDDGGVARDVGTPLPAGAVQGTGLAARWDTDRGRALLLTHPTATGTSGASPAPLQAWLVSYLSSSEATP